MPTYEYQCTSCGHQLEAVQSFSDDPLTKCPACGEPNLRKRFGNVGVVFKGSGFYRNDARAEQKSKGKSASSSTSSSSTPAETKSSGDSGKSDSTSSKPKAGSSPSKSSGSGSGSSSGSGKSGPA